jgi:hypothetical protein
MNGVMDFHDGPPFSMGLVIPQQIAGGVLLFQYYTNTWNLTSGGHGKLAVTNSDFSIYIGRLSFFMIYHYCAVVKRI